jgi:hypothetical protein
MFLPVKTQELNTGNRKRSFYVTRHPEEGTLLITFKTFNLDITPLQNLITRLANRPMTKVRRILFDLSTVEDLRGPWCSHFAAMALLAGKFKGKIDIRIIGLKGRPLAIASAFNRSTVIKDLLNSN